MTTETIPPEAMLPAVPDVEPAPEVGAGLVGVRRELHAWVRLHGTLLHTARNDLERRVETGRTPCYVIDYELLHRYVYGFRERSTTVELEYLFARDLKFIIGPGTGMEILHRLRTLGGKVGSSQIRREVARLNALVPPEEATARLARLLDLPNFQTIEDFQRDLQVRNSIDEAVAEATFDHLQRVRPRSIFPNIADALNIATVVGLRKPVAQRALSDKYPFLLTTTHWLFVGGDPTVSRAPLVAMYSDIVRRGASRPRQVGRRLQRLEGTARFLEQYFFSFPGAPTAAADWSTTDWKSLETLGGMGLRGLTPLHEIIKFCTDPIISEAQRVLDNTESAIASADALRGASQSTSSPRRAFDAFLALRDSAGLPRPDRQRISRLIGKVVKKESRRSGGVESVRFLSPREGESADLPHLEYDRYPDGLVVFRWPTTLALSEVLDAFNETLKAFRDRSARVLLGSDAATELPVEIETALPMGIDDLREQPQLRWLRMTTESADLYADFPLSAEVSPCIAFFTRKIDVDRLYDLLERTSARLTFRGWLEDVANRVNRSPQAETQSA